MHTSIPFSAVTGKTSLHIILNVRIAVNDSVKPRTHVQQYMLCSHALLAWNRVTNLPIEGYRIAGRLWAESFRCFMAKFSVVFWVFWCFKSGQFLFKMNYIVDLATSEGFSISLIFIWFFKPTTYSKSLLTLYWKFLLTARCKFNTWNHLLIFFFFLIWSWF